MLVCTMLQRRTKSHYICRPQKVVSILILFGKWNGREMTWMETWISSQSQQMAELFSGWLWRLDLELHLPYIWKTCTCRGSWYFLCVKYQVLLSMPRDTSFFTLFYSGKLYVTNEFHNQSSAWNVLSEMFPFNIEISVLCDLFYSNILPFITLCFSF